MGDRPWWATALQWGLWGATMALVMGWLARSRTDRPLAREGVLVQPKGILVIALLSTAFFGALVVLSVRFPGRNPSFWPPLVFAGFALMGLFMVADYYRARHELRSDGLLYGKTLGRGGLARWDEIQRVVYSETAKWFRLELQDGRVVRLSAMLRGLPELASELIARVPPQAIDARTRVILEATAAGEPPPVWQ